MKPGEDQKPALGAYSICNDYAAVIKQITHHRNTSLRTPYTYRLLAIEL
jgi:hypothetical protein